MVAATSFTPVWPQEGWGSSQSEGWPRTSFARFGKRFEVTFSCLPWPLARPAKQGVIGDGKGELSLFPAEPALLPQSFPVLRTVDKTSIRLPTQLFGRCA